MSAQDDPPLCDAHCHPTDSPSSLHAIAAMRTRTLLCMSTNLRDMPRVESLAAAHPARVVPAFGLHPWYSHLVYDDRDPQCTVPTKEEHYARVIAPQPPPEFVAALPAPVPLSTVVAAIEGRLAAFPRAIVGECGLDKIFRIPEPDSVKQDEDEAKVALENRRLSRHRVRMEHQIVVLHAQLELAARYRRPVSLHGVQCPGVLHETVAAGVSVSGTQAWPPAVCLHSYTGSAEFLQNNWLKTEGFKVYVSCSVLVNEKVHKDLARVLPIDRLLLESDYPKAGPKMDKLNVAILEKMSGHLGVSPAELGRRVADNLHRGFLAF